MSYELKCANVWSSISLEHYLDNQETALYGT